MKCLFSVIGRARILCPRAFALLVFVLSGLGWAPAQGAAGTETEPNGTSLTATFLSLPSGVGMVGAALNPSGDHDYFRFVASAGSKAWILVDTGGTNTIGADSYLTLLASNGITVLEEDDDDGTGNGCDATEESAFASAIAGHTLAEGGTYYAWIRAFDNEEVIDPYNVLVAVTTSAPVPETESNATAAEANSLVSLTASIGLRSGQLSQGSDVDVYSVATLAGSTLFISADCDPERNGGTDLVLDLIATNRSTVILTSNSSSNELGAAESFCFTVPVSGTYYLRVRSGNQASGSYHLMGATRGSGTFQFSANAYTQAEGGSASISVFRLGGSLGTATVQLATSNGTAVANSDYTAISQTLTFTEGVSTQSVSVVVAPDALAEANESILLSLKNPTGGAGLGNPSTATIVILDDDEQPNGSAATATPFLLSSGFIVTQAVSLPLVISPSGDQDWFSFTAPPGAALWALVDSGGPQNPEANSRDVELTLFAPDGTTILEVDDDDGSGSGTGMAFPLDGGSDSAIAGKTLVEGGLYYLRVKAFSPAEIISPYSLFLLLTSSTPPSEGEPNNAPGFANTLVTPSLGTAQRLAQIGSPGDFDYFTVTVPSNCLIYVNIDCDPERDGGSTDLIAELLSTDGITRLFTADSSGTNANAAEAFCVRVTNPGTYFLRIQHLSASGMGAYRVMASRQPQAIEPNETPGTAAQLDLLNQFLGITRELTPAGDSDYYSFLATPNSRIWLTVDTGGNQNPGATSRDSVLTVLASDGTTVIEMDDNDGTGNGHDESVETGDASAIAGRTLVAGGNYFIKVAAAQAANLITPYTLYGVVTTTPSAAEVEPNNGFNTATPLLGAAPSIGLRSATIGFASDSDIYSLVASAGDLVHISADADPERDGVSTDLRLELLSRAGDSILLSANSSNSGLDPAAEAFSFLIPAEGTYFLRVAHTSGGTGSYHILASRDNTALRISRVTRVGPDALISFPTEFGRRYQVEYVNSLNSPRVWTTVSVFSGNGQMMTALDQAVSGQTVRFYQIRLVP